jgi:hypothetical protein
VRRWVASSLDPCDALVSSNEGGGGDFFVAYDTKYSVQLMLKLRVQICRELRADSTGHEKLDDFLALLSHTRWQLRAKQLEIASRELRRVPNAVLCGDFNFCSERNFVPRGPLEVRPGSSGRQCLLSLVVRQEDETTQ